MAELINGNLFFEDLSAGKEDLNQLTYLAMRMRAMHKTDANMLDTQFQRMSQNLKYKY